MREKLRKIKKVILGIHPFSLGLILFFFLMLIPSDSSFFKLREYYLRAQELHREKAELQEKLRLNRLKLEELQFDDSELERYAREVYMMKAEDEDIYIIDREEFLHPSSK